MLKSLFKGEAKGTLIQLFRYVFVGGAAFLVDFGVLYVLTKFAGMGPVLAATISFILGLITNYVLSIAWVFNNRKMGSRWMEFLIFALIGVIGLVFNDLIIHFFTSAGSWGIRDIMVTVLARIFTKLSMEQVVQMNIMLAKIISTIIVFFWNFFARKFILFKTNKQEEK